jgi:vitamin B12/bleomycin/antimicrobial peptide transport system ATP-binding/permease protein
MVRPNESDRERLLRFSSTASGFWRGRSALASWPLSIALLTVAVSQLAVQYRLNYWNRDFFNAIELRDSDRLWHQAAIFVPLAFLSVSLSVSAVWARMTTQRKWREWVTTTVLGTWLGQERYRRLESVEGEYKNAEYRISFDIRTATDAPIDLAFGFVSSALTAFVFIGVLWTVGGGFTFVVAGVELTVPGYLVLGVGVYALTFSAAMLAIGRNLPSVIQTENQAEAELLAAANQIRESAKQPATSAKEIDQQTLAWDALRQVLARWRQLCWQLMGTTTVTQTDLLFAPVVAWLLCAPKYLAGTMTLGELTQASAAFVTVQVAFNWLVDNYQRLSDWRSAAGRVATLLLALDKVVLLDGGDERVHAENSK